jgi:hypothetical protein
VHLRVHKRIRAARADACDVNVMIDESTGINVIVRTLDEIFRFATEIRGQFSGMSFEGAADLMD